MADCFKELRKNLPDDITDDTIRQVIAEVERLKDEPDFRGAAGKLLNDQRGLRARALKERAQNLMKTKERLSLYGQFKNKTTGLLAAFEGSVKLAKGGGLSVYRRQQVIQQDLMNALYHGLKDEGVFDLVKQGGLDREIMQELFELRPGGRSGISGSDEALKAAKVFRKVQQRQLFHLRKAGIDIGETPGFIMSQSHNRELINPNVTTPDVDFRAWVSEIGPKLDERTFEGVTNREEFLRKVFDDITTGKRQKVDPENVSDLLITSKGFSPNMSKKLGAARVLHFKSGEDFFQYNQKFGSKDLMQATVSTLDNTSRTAGLVEVFGTNPRAAVEADMRRLEIDDKGRRKIEAAMREAEGVTSIPGRGIGARMTAGARMIASMSKLGGSAIAGMVDTATAGAAIRSATGDNYFSSLGKGMQGFAENLSPGQKKEFYRKMWYGAEDLLSGMYHRFTLDENQPGALSKAQNMFFKLNGAQFQASTARAAVASSLSQTMADNWSKKSFGSLPERVAANLEQFGINADNWDLVRQGVESIGDRKFLTPEAIEGLPDNLFKNAQQKTELAQRVSIYLSDFAEVGSPNPGARERRILLRGHEADSGEGMALRLLTQFKSFPIAMHAVVSRSLLSDPKRTAETLTEAIKTGDFDGQNLAGVIVAGTGIAYMAMSAKALASGQTPPDPTDPKTWTEAFVRSGTAGLYGDFLFGEYDQMFRSVLKDAVGPVLGQADDVGEIYASAIRGDLKGNKIVRLLKNNLPGQNLFYTKAAMDYLIWWRINEALNPGYIRRMKKRVRNEGREFLVEPGG
jgi:hypothetical protein